MNKSSERESLNIEANEMVVLLVFLALIALAYR